MGQHGTIAGLVAGNMYNNHGFTNPIILGLWIRLLWLWARLNWNSANWILAPTPKVTRQTLICIKDRLDVLNHQVHCCSQSDSNDSGITVFSIPFGCVSCLYHISYLPWHGPMDQWTRVKIIYSERWMVKKKHNFTKIMSMLPDLHRSPRCWLDIKRHH
jgi:hypothetical protein